MTENKMTEAEIMKALECCKAYNYDACSECPFNRNADCAFAVATNCLDLINRKNAEIDRLEAEMKFIRQYIHDNGLEWDLLAKYKIAKEMGVE